MRFIQNLQIKGRNFKFLLSFLNFKREFRRIILIRMKTSSCRYWHWRHNLVLLQNIVSPSFLNLNSGGVKSENHLHLFLPSSAILCHELIIHQFWVKDNLDLIRVLCWDRSWKNFIDVVAWGFYSLFLWARMGFSFRSGGVEQVFICIDV